jgi:phosphate starvation-inducible PhoH-like protein
MVKPHKYNLDKYIIFMKLFMGLFTLSLQFSRFISFQNKAVFTNINRLIHNSPLLYARPKKTDKYIDKSFGDSFDSKKSGKSLSALYKPRTENQASYVKHLTDVATPIVVGVGPAGSGKTLFACCQAVSALNAGFIQKIILTRPVVPVEEDMGFLPGDLKQKMDPWTRPIFDILLEFYAQKDIDTMLHNGVLEISPLAYMRGRTFKNAFIIADEMQNSSPNQMLMLTTRIGDKSKLVITGDLQQCDRGVANGLADFITKVRAYEIRDAIDRKLLGKKKEGSGIRIVEMNSLDIQRSPIVTKLIDIYSGEPRVPPDAPFSREPTVPLDEPSLLRGTKFSSNSTIFSLDKRDGFSKGTGGSLDSLEIYQQNLTTYYSKNKYDGDAALIPSRYNTTDTNKYPWTPMDF